MTLAIGGVAYELPAKVVTNDDLALDHPDWDMSRVGSRTGVLRRYIAVGETALEIVSGETRHK